jgi:hypothetical protein
MAVVMHGYVIETELALQLPEAPAGLPVDMTIRYGGVRPVPWQVPPGELIADVRDERTGTFYSFARSGGRLLLRFHGAAEIEADDGLRDLTAYVSPEADPGLLSVLITGAVIAARLVLDGRLVLHASAFAANGAAIAFVGKSGMGKSTMCTLAGAAGFPLVGDDVLRVDVDAAPPIVWPAATETRLRASASSLADHFGAGASRTTADGRLALEAARRVMGPVPLAVCVVPLPSREISEVSVEVLPGASALARLLAFPRLVGWMEPRTSAAQFQRLADLCERVPVVQAHLPWGPPFRPETVLALVDALSALVTLDSL